MITYGSNDKVDEI